MTDEKDPSEDTSDGVIIDIDDSDGETPVNANSSGGNGQDLAACHAEIDDLKKKYLYLAADFDNYRKQAIKERSDLVKYGNEPVVREFLSVLDNLERAAATPLTAESMETYKSGVEMIVSQFKKTLERFGVEEVDPKGQVFDPALHEALGSDKNPDFPPNTVTQVLKKAYKLRGKVIRPAQVLVNTSTS